MLNWIMSRISTRQSKTHATISSPVQAVYPEINFRKLSQVGYQSNVYVYRCVNLIANTFSGVPIRLYLKDSDDRDIQIETHPALTLLDKPNPYQGGSDFRRNLISYLEISGNTFVERVAPSPEAPPKELFLIRPDLMKIIRGDRVSPILGYEYNYRGLIEFFPYKDVFHGKLFNPLDDPIIGYGQSPLQVALKSIVQVNCAMDWNNSLIQNSANPSLMIKFKGSMGDGQFEDIKKQFEGKFTGPNSVGQVFIAEEAIDLVKMSLSPEEMQILDLLQQGAKQICITYGVDSSLISDSANKTYSNFKESRSALYEDVMIPLLDWFKDDFLNGWLLPQFPGTENMYFDYSVDDIEALNEDRTIVYTRTLNAFNAGVISLNEARECLGFSEMEEDEAIEQPDEVEEPSEATGDREGDGENGVS